MVIVMERVLKRVHHMNWKKAALLALIATPVLMIVVQFLYPYDKAMLYATSDGVVVSGMSRDASANAIDKKYQSTKLDVYFGDSDAAYKSPSLEDLGVSVDSKGAVDAVMYPWWLRLVPTSLWWGHMVVADKQSHTQLNATAISAYVSKELGDSCHIEPKNASIEMKDNELALKPSEGGGTCEISDVIGRIETLPIVATEQNSVRIPVKRIAPSISDADAEALIKVLKEHLAKDVSVKIGGSTVSLRASDVESWLQFGEKDGKLVTKLNEEKARSTIKELLESKVAKKPGVVTITTKDFQEISRSGGGNGTALDTNGTLQNITKYLTGGVDIANVAVTTIPPEKKYIRTYSPTDTGLSALIQHYAEAHKGTYGVSLIELSGQRRRAGYNETRKFTTASTYKLYVAYSVLKRIDKGEYEWTDSNISDGRNLEKCFDDMIVKSDNACAEAFVKKIGYTPLHKDVTSLGLKNTSFIDKESFKTTSGDLAKFMASLESSQLPITKDSRSRFIGALKRNVYRQGIPTGVSGTVADKVGFLDGLLHDAAIVYAPTGTYVLTIMTDGSSWATIADLAKQIQSLKLK